MTEPTKNYSEIGLEIALEVQALPHSQRLQHISNRLSTVLDPQVRALVQHVALQLAQIRDPAEIELARQKTRADRITIITLASFLTALVFVVLGIFCIANTATNSSIQAWGVSVSTDSVGVACIALGVVLALFTARSAFKHI